MRKPLQWVRAHWEAIAVGLVLAALLLGNKGLRMVVVRTLELRKLDSGTARLKQEEGDLRRRISQARFDERALEKAARKELGYIKPGEVEYRFPPPK